MNEGVRSVLSDARLQAVNVCLSERRRQSVRDVVHFPGQGPRHLHTDYYPVHLDDRGPTLVAVVTRFYALATTWTIRRIHIGSC